MAYYNSTWLYGTSGRPALPKGFWNVVGTDVETAIWDRDSYCGGYTLNLGLEVTQAWLASCSDGFLECTSQNGAGSLWFYDDLVHQRRRAAVAQPEPSQVLRPRRHPAQRPVIRRNKKMLEVKNDSPDHRSSPVLLARPGHGGRRQVTALAPLQDGDLGRFRAGTDLRQGASERVPRGRLLHLPARRRQGSRPASGAPSRPPAASTSWTSPATSCARAPRFT